MIFKENKELIDIAHLLTGIDERRAEYRPARKLAEDVFLKLYYIASMETSMLDDTMSREESDKLEEDFYSYLKKRGYDISKEQLHQRRVDGEAVGLDMKINRLTKMLLDRLDDPSEKREPKGMVDGRPYPLTITLDRYSGVYSGGLYVAWNCDADAVPTEPSDDDVTCAGFWDRAEQYMLDGDIPCYGIGVNPEKAILNLVEAMLAKEMAEEVQNDQ